MRRVALVYFSATGGTKVVAELLEELLGKELRESGRLGPEWEISLCGIEGPQAPAAVRDADFLVLCYPTYYLKPASPMRDFAAGIGPFEVAKPCYLVTTCELYSENSARRLAKVLTARGFAVVGSRAIRAPGTDVTAVLPAGIVPWLYRYGRGFESGLRAAVADIAEAATLPPAAGTIPRPRWYTPLTQLLQVLALNHFDAVKYRLRVIDGRCTRCGFCADGCPGGALSMGSEGVLIQPDKCLLCCRCVHGCPSRAIVLSEGLKDNRRIDAALLGELKGRARVSLGLSAAEGGNGA